MKAYLFNIDNGIYSGEDFFDSRDIKESEGITAKSPPNRQPGTVPVFDRTSGQWQLVPVNSLRTVENRHDCQE